MEKFKTINDLISRSNENEKLKADLRGKENEIEVLKWRVEYLSKFEPKEHEEQYRTFLEINNIEEDKEGYYIGIDLAKGEDFTAYK
ncbi:MAG: hypothetical protein ACREV6_19590 [Clostridium sp.]|uniref:hypothetical protein n=1 Tax=Clostridium sp. TaxID=1506 RepID=UPI003D6D690F